MHILERQRSRHWRGILLSAVCWPVILCAVCAAPGCDAPSPEARETAQLAILRVGVQSWSMSVQTTRELARIEQALEHALAARDARRDVTIVPFVVYGELVAALTGGRVDAARLESASYLVARRRAPEVALLAMERPSRAAPARGIIFTSKSAGIDSLAGLRGRTFAFGDELAAIGRYLPQAALVGVGLHASDLHGFAYLQRPDKVAAAVRLGEFDAGAVELAIFQRANRDDSLRVLARVDDAPRPWVARAGLDPALVISLGESLGALTDPQALAVLHADGFDRADPDAYDAVGAAMTAAARF